MYRGWYKGVRTFGSAKVPWEFCVAEWDSQFLGDRAFQITEFEKEDIRFEAKKFRTGTLFFRWDYPYEVGTSKFADRQTVRAMYLTDNFRAFRMWGLSANTPSELESYWTLREGLERNKRVDLATAWDKLQQPGFSPDFIEKRFERMDQAYARSDWIPTPAALALVRNNRPLLGCISGAVAHVTSKDHNLQAGEVLEKQLIVINNSRAPVSCALTWSLGALGTASGSATVSVETGQSQRIPLSLTLPATLAPGSYDLKATFAFANGETQTDQFQIDVAPKPGAAAAATTGTISLYDPSGETAATLDRLNVHYHTIDATTPVGKGDILVIGKAALTVNGPAPDVRGVRTGGRVLIFEQKSEVLEKRFGFRIEEYGLRQVFKRIPDHALLAGIETASLHDWNGDATLLPPRLASEPNPRYYGAPTVTWCGMDVTRLWRCGNRGDVASVLIEKPTSGDFLPVLDGGFSLQYTPLVEYREGSGLILFCQADVTGRSTVDPAADALCRNLIKRISSFTPAPSRACVYIGDPAGKEYLGHAGVPVSGFAGTAPAKDQILVIAPGAGKELTDHASAIRAWITAGGALLAIGLDAATANQVLPFTIATTKTEHIASFFEPPSADSPFAGIGPADVQNRDPRDFPLITGGAAALGDGILAKSTTGTVVFCQLTPWAFDYSKQYDIKRTFRRSAFVLSRLLANLGVHAATTLLDNISTAVDASKGEKRWLNGLYLDIPEDTDDPYRFFGW
jgi:hypothetical protein